MPNADDPFYVVDELTTAKEIAEAQREEGPRGEAASSPSSVKDLDKAPAAKSKLKISELKVILKAEARGSVEAIQQGAAKS